jgi:membrane-associated phospholipid phosphatase
MNIDPRFEAGAQSPSEAPDPIHLLPPSWLPWREIAVIAICTAVLCAMLIAWGDLPIARLFGARRDEPWVDVFRTITHAGSSAYWYTLAALGFLVALWKSRQSLSTAVSWEWRRRARAFVFMMVSMAISGTLVNLLKISFGRYRPRFWFNDGTYEFAPFALALRDSGFPSGHSQSIVAAMMALGFIWPRGRAVFWSFALIVASSRFITTVHYASDVVAGAFVAAAVAWSLRRYFERNGIMLAWASSRGKS